MSGWADGFPSATAPIDCGGAEHRISWRHGKLVLHDHDVDAERALTALGGEPPICLELLEGWRASMRDPTLLVTLLRAPVPLARPDLGQLRAQVLGRMSIVMAQAVVTSRTPRGLWRGVRSLEQGRWLRTLLENAPPELRRALIASVAISCQRTRAAHAIAREFMMDDVMAQIALDAVYESIRSWAPPGGLVRLPVHVTVRFEPDTREPVLQIDGLGSVTALEVALTLWWIADVWARGIALVDGCFVLEVLERRARGAALLVRALRWERARRGPVVPVEAEAIVVRTDDGSWHLGWRAPAA